MAQSKCVNVTVDEIGQKLQSITVISWKKLPLWLGWATKLDETDIWYVVPMEYNILKKLTGVAPPYENAIIGGRICLRFLGKVEGLAMPAGEVWCEEWKDGLPEEIDVKLTKKERVLTSWAQVLYKCLKENPDLWKAAYNEGLSYFMLHRHYVRCIGKLLNESMEDHDLTKTNLVLYALAYSWYWPKDVEVDPDIKAKAWTVIQRRHLAQEDHHPEHEQFEGGTVSAKRLFCDRLSVHIQKNPGEDGENGWKIADWIPDEHKESFKLFQEQSSKKNLYVIRTWKRLKPPTFELPLYAKSLEKFTGI